MKVRGMQLRHKAVWFSVNDTRPMHLNTQTLYTIY